MSPSKQVGDGFILLDILQRSPDRLGYGMASGGIMRELMPNLFFRFPTPRQPTWRFRHDPSFTTSKPRATTTAFALPGAPPPEHSAGNPVAMLTTALPNSGCRDARWRTGVPCSVPIQVLFPSSPHNIANVDAYSELDAVVRSIVVVIGHARLPVGCTAQRINHAGEFDQ